MSLEIAAAGELQRQKAECGECGVASLSLGSVQYTVSYLSHDVFFLPACCLRYPTGQAS